MNVRDSEALIGLFLDKGYGLTDDVREADVILVNTCSVREHAEHRAISFLGSLKKVVKNDVSRPTEGSTSHVSRIIGLIGCAARNKGAEVFQKMPHVNLVVGPAWFDKISEFVERIEEQGVRIKEIGDKEREESLYSGSYRCESDSAQVVISTGCNNWCSYCIVPYVRGGLRFRKPEDIIEEVKRNVDRGFRKITLLGQNVNDYEYNLSFDFAQDRPRCFERGRPRCFERGRQTTVKFLELLKKVEKIDGIDEIYFISAHPRNTSKELFDFMAESDKMKKQLHLPFQSGSNRILKLMGRGYTREWYLELIDYYKEKVGGTLGTDVIVGFPTETDQDFEQTRDVLERVKFNYAFIFTYSPRPHSRAFTMKDDVPAEVKKERHAILLDSQKRISQENVHSPQTTDHR